MKNRRGGLGRGLGALIPTTPVPTETGGGHGSTLTAPPAAGGPDVYGGVMASPGAAPTPRPAPDASDGDQTPEVALEPVPGATFRELPVDAIIANAKQPRTVFDEEALEELKASVNEVGILQPVVVRETSPGQYELVMGERRWRACKAVGRDTIPAIIRDTGDDAMLRDALLENIHRSNLNPLEEAAAYQQLLAEFGATQEELAQRIGRSRPQISNTIRLLNLPAVVQRRVAAGVLSAGHARALLALDSVEQQEDLAQRIVAEGLSVRATEEIVALAGSEGPGKKVAVRRAKPRSPGLEDLADRLSDRFDTRVKVDLGRRKGRITIEFGSVDDLERIAETMGVHVRVEKKA
jgi:ParB family chromosome partitioning protein